MPGVEQGVEILLERPLDKDRLCLVKAWKSVQLEVWVKTRRRKSPWDRLVVGSMTGSEDGLSLNVARGEMQKYRDRIAELLPEFNDTAIVEVVSAR